MTPQDYLKYQILLLLAAYGEERVMPVLAELRKMAPADLKSALEELEKEPLRRTKLKRSNPYEVIESIINSSPEKSTAIRQVIARYNSKAFLPDLQSVRRFIERHSGSQRTFKSRAEALPILAQLLTSLEVEELKRLAEQHFGAGYSSLGIIADQILKRERK